MLSTAPLAEGFGVEIAGLDLAQPLSDGQFAEIERLFVEHAIVVFRGQRLSPRHFRAFAGRFGRAEPHAIDQFHHPEVPDILILSNVRSKGKPIGLADGGTYFHSDYAYLEVPARCTSLYSVQVPWHGGNTLFADQRAAYDDLPEATRKRIDSLAVIHHYGNRDDLDERSRTVASPLSGDQWSKMPVVVHPLVRVHPDSGRQALYAVAGSAFGIVGMPDDEGIALLDELKAHATQPRYQLSLAYGVGDVVVWDNASLLHSATLTDPRDPRTLWRITIKDDRVRGTTLDRAPKH